jgi:hypothetical protein
MWGFLTPMHEASPSARDQQIDAGFAVHSLKDTILIYRKTRSVDVLRESRTQKSDAIYRNPDNDPRGPWTSSSYVNPATKAQRRSCLNLLSKPRKLSFNYTTVPTLIE